MNKLVLILVCMCVSITPILQYSLALCKKAWLISYQGRPNWHRGITPLCVDSKRDASTLDVSISNNCDLEARGITLCPPTPTPPPSPPICWLLNSARASWFWVSRWRANRCYLRGFYWLNWVWLLFYLNGMNAILRRSSFSVIACSRFSWAVVSPLRFRFTANTW